MPTVTRNIVAIYCGDPITLATRIQWLDPFSEINYYGLREIHMERSISQSVPPTVGVHVQLVPSVS